MFTHLVCPIIYLKSFQICFAHFNYSSKVSGNLYIVLPRTEEIYIPFFDLHICVEIFHLKFYWRLVADLQCFASG